METKKRVLSGIRASGRLHIGNYLGMVKEMIKLQDSKDHQPFFMVADLHAMTTPFDPENLNKNVREVVIDYLSAGLDPQKAVLFVQSDVPEHIELSYLFSTEVSLARLSHLPTYKDKVKQYPQNNTLALLYYPVLMAADILLYKTDHLPVGDDQLPHLEITREIARKFNEKYGTNFPEPVQMKSQGQYVPSLTGEGKMSKSVAGSFISLTDDLKTIQDKLAAAPTDSGKGESVPTKGGVANLLVFVELFEGTAKRKYYEKLYTTTGIKYQDLKKKLAQAIFNEIKPMQEKRFELLKNQEYIDEVLEDGATKARAIARKTVSEVRFKMGLD